MNERTTDTVYVVFQQAASGAWWDAFCHPAYRHCWMFGPTYSPERSLTAVQSTVVLEPLADYLVFDHWNVRPEIAASEIAARPEVTAVIAVRIKRPPDGFMTLRGLRGLISCVSVLKYAMGIRAPFVWTPSQLCDYLLFDLAGVVVRSSDNGRCGQEGIRGREAEGRPDDCGKSAPTAGAARCARSGGRQADREPPTLPARRHGGQGAPRKS